MNNIIKRDSNYELMRIISMILIIITHAICYGEVIPHCTNPSIKLFFEIVDILCLVHVNSFVLVSGYYQCKSTFKQSKVWKLLNTSFFYRIVIYSIFLFFGLITFNKIDFFINFSYLDIVGYWFIKVYLILYLISPFLNKLINNLDKKDFIKLIVVSFLIISLIPFITANNTFENDGFTLYNFIFLYFVGAYFRIYPLDKNYIFKKLSKNSTRLIFIFIFLISMMIKILLYKFLISIANYNEVFNQIKTNNYFIVKCYASPGIIIASIAYFLYFGTLSFKNNFINKISSLTFGIYIIHDNIYLRMYLYKWLGIDNGNISSYKYILYFFAIILVIFIICAIIEYIRQLLFKFLYNRKISKKVRDNYYKFLSSFSMKGVD